MPPPSRATPLLLVLVLAACGAEQDPVGAQDRERFVEVNVALREAGSGARDSVLAAHGTTEDWLLEFSALLADDPDRLADTWDEIQRRLDPVATAGAPADTSSRTPLSPALRPPLDEVPPAELAPQRPEEGLPAQPQ
jgi:hypothetical protein